MCGQCRVCHSALCYMYVGGIPSFIHVCSACLHTERGVPPALLPTLHSTCMGGSLSCKSVCLGNDGLLKLIMLLLLLLSM
jgi:hypothetical protein